MKVIELGMWLVYNFCFTINSGKIYMRKNILWRCFYIKKEWAVDYFLELGAPPEKVALGKYKPRSSFVAYD